MSTLPTFTLTCVPASWPRPRATPLALVELPRAVRVSDVEQL